MSLYPVNLKVEGRLCTVIGGGAVALRKVESLLGCGARVRVVSPALDSGFEPLHGRFEHVARPYHWGDLKDSFMAIAATDDEDTNRAVEEEARGRHVLVNVVDSPGQCDFYVPSSVVRGDLMITVSTGGQLPALSRQIRKRLEVEFPEEWAGVLDLMGKARQRLTFRIKDEEERRRCLTELAEMDLLPVFLDGGREAVEAAIDKCISQY